MRVTSMRSTGPISSLFRLDFRKSSRPSEVANLQPDPSPAPHGDSQPVPPVGLPSGVGDLPSPGMETNGVPGKEEEVAPSPGSGSLLGDLPSLGGPGVRGTSLPPLGGLGKPLRKFTTLP